MINSSLFLAVAVFLIVAAQMITNLAEDNTHFLTHSSGFH